MILYIYLIGLSLALDFKNLLELKSKSAEEGEVWKDDNQTQNKFCYP
jgi:hypothetical protein